MLGGSLAAQPEHETISVKRMRSPPLLSEWEGNGLYHCQLLIGDCQGRLAIPNGQLSINNRAMEC